VEKEIDLKLSFYRNTVDCEAPAAIVKNGGSFSAMDFLKSPALFSLLTKVLNDF
jgi:hypothetical protein